MKRWKSAAGFSTTEAVVSAAVMAAGTLGVSGLFIYGTQMQSIARYGSGATGVATARLERLRMLPVSALERSNGGSLTAPLQHHSAAEGLYDVRWVISDGPAGTKDVTVLAVHKGGAGATGTMARRAEVRTLLWR